MTAQSAEALSRADLPVPQAIPAAGVVGAEVLGELPAEVALWVWHGLRTVLLWAREEPEGRGELFEAGAMEAWEHELLLAGFDPEVRFPLAVLARQMSTPVAASPPAVSWACLCIADWALGKQAVGTGLGFAEAAALAWPEHTRYAWTAGRLLRAHGRTREADLWLRRTVRIAAKAGDWESQARSLTALGNLHVHSGNYPRAHDMHRLALRVARKHRMVEQEGMALHDLFVVTTLTGDFRDADDYARLAFEAYGPGHPRVPALAYDIAYYWIQQRDFRSALTLLLPMCKRFAGQSDETLRVLGSIVHAAAGTRDETLFARFYPKAWALAESLERGTFLAAALLDIGEGAMHLDRVEWAERALERCVEVASQTGESDVLLKAEDRLEKLRSEVEQADEVSVSVVMLEPQGRRGLAQVIASALQAA